MENPKTAANPNVADADAWRSLAYMLMEQLLLSDEYKHGLLDFEEGLPESLEYTCSVVTRRPESLQAARQAYRELLEWSVRWMPY